MISALRILSNDIQSDDGVANAAIAEAADRMEEMLELIDGAYDVVEIMRTDGSPYNTQWKKDWLTKAYKCGANPSV